MELTSKDLNGFITEGSQATEDLCSMAELMGYKSKGMFSINQMQLNNGCFVSSLLSFFEDNPGVIKAIHEWVRDEYADDIQINDDANPCDNGGCEDETCEQCFDQEDPDDKDDK